MLNERNIVTTKQDMVLPYEHGSKTSHLVLDVEDMLRIRARITELYFNQKVFVAPCLSKLYFSTDIKMDGTICRDKESPEWLYFGTGAMAVIYDTAHNEVKLALFDKNDVRLLWCLKWATYVNLEKAGGNFHVINTEPDDSHRIGILYENNDVADVIAQTVTLIYSSVQMTINTPNENNKCKLRQCNSVPVTKPSSKKDENNINRSSLRGSLLKRTTENFKLPMTRGERSLTIHELPSIAARNTQIVSDERPKSECSDSRLLRLSRADSFRRNRSKSNPEQDKVNEKHGRKASGEENNKIKDSILKALFKKRRITRTQSLKVEDEACSNGDSKQFERAVKLVKPRASTDTMLLKGDSMRFVIETGLCARNARESRHWMKALSTEEMPSTDLCVTEL